MDRTGSAKDDLNDKNFDIVLAASKMINSVMEELGQTSFYYGLIHSDTHPGNMLIHNSEIAIIDFNDCGWGHYLFDLGVMLFDLSFMFKQRDYSPQKCTEYYKAVLEGYEQITRVPATDQTQIEAFIALRCLSSLEWIVRSHDPDERREALKSQPGVSIIYEQLENYIDGKKLISSY